MTEYSKEWIAVSEEPEIGTMAICWCPDLMPSYVLASFNPWDKNEAVGEWMNGQQIITRQVKYYFILPKPPQP